MKHVFVAMALLTLAQDPRPAPGPHTVATLEYPDFADAARGNRTVPIKVHYPKGDGRHPLAIYSHGGAGNWDAHLHEAAHLASHGYIVLCVEHVCSNTSKVQELIKAGKGTVKERLQEALRKIVSHPDAVLGRPKDISFAIDRAVEWNEKHAILKGRIDTSKIAVLGHSFGAYTTLVACGARPILDHLDPKVEPGSGLAPDLSDARITIGVAMSPQGVKTSRFGPESFKSLNRPILAFSGTKDTELAHDGKEAPPEDRLEGFKLWPEGGKVLLWLENADHFSFADNPKSGLFPSAAREDAMRIVKEMTRLFLDWKLKGLDEAKTAFTAKHVDELLGKVVTRVTWNER